jgi:hypothetical protein
MAKKTMAELLEAVTNKKAFKSDDTVSEIEQVGLDKTTPDDEIDELEVDGKSKAGLSAEEKTNKSSTKSGQDKMVKSSKVAEAKEEDEDDSDEDDQDDDKDSDEDEDDEDLKEALRLYGALVEAELDDEDDEDEDDDSLEEGRMKHPLSADELALRKAITKKQSLIHYYEKGKKTGTKYNKTKGPGGDVNNLKKEVEVLKAQLKAKRAKSHPKNKTMLNNSVEVDVRKVTVEDFDSSADLAAIFGSNDTLSEEFTTKAKTIYESSVVAKANEVVSEVYDELKEAFVAEQEILVNELTEAYSAKVDELIEQVDRYLDKTINDWKKENEVQIQSRAKYDIAESFMSKLKTLFEDHYIDLPEEKVSVVDSLQARVDELEESLQKEIDKNIDLQEEIDSKEKDKIVEEMSEGLSDVQKEKFTFLVETLDLENKETFVEKLKEIKTAYFGSSSKKEMIKESYEEEGIEIDQDVKKPVSKNVMIDQSVAAISRYLGKK